MADLSAPYSVKQIKALPKDGGENFAGVLLVKRVSGKVAKNGNPFLNVELGDKTGSFGLNVFSDSPAYDLINGMKEVVPDVLVDVSFAATDRWHKEAEAVWGRKGKRLLLWHPEKEAASGCSI